MEEALNGRASRRGLITVLLTVTIVGTVFIAVLFDRLDLLAIGAFLSFVPLVFLGWPRNKPFDFFAPEVGFPILYVLYLFVATINVPVASQFNMELPWTQWLYYSEGLVFYLLGTAIIRRKTAFSIPLEEPRFWNQTLFFVAIAILLGAGALGRGIKIATVGIPVLRPEDQELRVQYAGGYAGTLALALETIPICLVLFLSVCKPSKRVQGFIWLLLVVLGVDALSGDSRGGLMRVAVSSLIVLHYARSRIRFKSLVAFGMIAVIFVSAIGTYRNLSVFGSGHVESLEKKGYSLSTLWVADAYESVRVTTEGLYMLMQQVENHHSYTYGTTSLAALAIPLPGHRPGPGEIIKKQLGFDFVGFGASATMLGPLYLDGGWIAIAIGMFLWGVLAKSIHIKMLTSDSYFWLLAYAYFSQNQFKAIKDEMFPELGPVFAILFFAFVHFFCNRRSLLTYRVSRSNLH